MGRHAAPRDETFDQRERETAGAHRADVEPLGPAPAKKKAAPVKTAASTAKTTASRKTPSTPKATSKKAGSS
jgi:hypothetical protein